MKMKNVQEANPIEKPTGITRTTLAYNDEAMLCHFAMKKGSQIPLHNHRATQIGYVIKGNLRFIGGSSDKEFEVKTGDSYVFSKHVTHGCIVLEDSECIEVFVPVRDEYKDF